MSTEKAAALPHGVEDPSSAYSLDGQVGFLLRCAYQRASGNLLRRIADHGLTPAQFSVMARLYERGSMSQNRLGRLVGMEPANIRDVVQRLKRRGLLETRPAPDDARRLVIDFSEKGRSLIARLIPLEIESSAQTLASLNPEEQQTLLQLLGRLVEAEDR
ncbi:MAG: transcriptional regulator [Rhizobiaceae bacterium MnEN-MB40S]|nr:MAG: transcriptional regulator [Rhizobiaceae bacterium MnEN-MB40S]